MTIQLNYLLKRDLKTKNTTKMTIIYKLHLVPHSTQKRAKTKECNHQTHIANQASEEVTPSQYAILGNTAPSLLTSAKDEANTKTQCEENPISYRAGATARFRQLRNTGGSLSDPVKTATTGPRMKYRSCRT